MSKKHLLTIIKGITASALALIPFCSASAWGPERTTYTVEVPAPYATFNSITNNPAVGDERNFVRIGEADSTDPYRDEIEVVPGKEYEVYIYFHNNAASNTNSTGVGMATNARVYSAFPTVLNVGERGMVSGIISWSYVTPENPNNAQMGEIWDEAYVTTSTDGVVLRYKPGTAIIHNSGKANGSVLPSTFFTDEGAMLGYNQLIGNLPGCDEYSGYITYTLVAEKVDLSLEKQVSVDGQNWFKNVNVKPGDYVTYKVVFQNTGNTDFTNLIFQDSHDNGLSLRSGSTKIFDVNNVDGKVIDDILDLSGYNVGDVAAGALVQVIYQVKVAEGTDYCNKTLKNVITAKYNSTEERTDEATVTVVCDETPPELPNTGPLEIVMAAVVIAGIGGGGYYLYRTRKTLSKVENTAKGEDASKFDAEAKPDTEVKSDTELKSDNEPKAEGKDTHSEQ